MLKRQAGIYHFRRRVPAVLQAALGKSEIWCSLRTSRLTEARARAGLLYYATERIFALADDSEELRRRNADEAAFLRKMIAEDLEFGERLSEATEQLKRVQLRIAGLGGKLSESRSARAEITADLAKIVASVQNPPIATVRSSPKLSELIEDFLAEKKLSTEDHRGYSEQVVRQTRVTLRLLVELIGDKPVREYTGTDAGKFRELLLRLPASHGKSRSNILDASTAIERASADTPRLAMKTVKRHFSSLSQYWIWLTPREHVDRNIFQGFTFPGTRSKKKKRNDWSESDLRLLFTSEWYRSRAPDSAEHWLPVIALYSGLRLEEIARLRPRHDIKAIDGVHCFLIQEHKTPAAWSPKSEAGARKVPVHSKLIELGMLDLVQQRDNLPYLWPDLPPSGPDAKKGFAFSREFSKKKQSLGVDEKTTFHSFRHTARTILESTDLPERWIDAVFGHENAQRSEGGTTYAKRVEIAPLVQVVEAIRPSVDPVWFATT